MEHINSFKDIKQYIPDIDSINSQQIIHAFDILLREKMISEQEYFRAINKIKEKYNTIYNNDK